MADIAATIIAFAAHLEDPRTDPLIKAVDRSWLDASGAPTTDGIALVSALSDQSGTRTTLRNFA